MADPGPAVGIDLGAALRTASQRLVRTVDALPDDDWAARSRLPGWTRGHVIAHLVLNAEGLAGALEGAAVGAQVPMYRSAEARDDDIDVLAATDPAAVRERMLGSTTRMAVAISQVSQVAEATGTEILTRTFERSPGGPLFVVGQVADVRLREVEIHHADLDAGYSSADWDPWFAGVVLDALTARPTPVADVIAAPLDVDRRWVLGAGGPVVVGPIHALAWWLTGRSADEQLAAANGPLPQVASW